ncbi:MAG: GMP synthase [Chitinophagaceae bacterium]|nr:GMP synthase [Chitinophagaceae bacterium]
MSDQKNTTRIAILDLYDGAENQGMRCIRELINQWSDENKIDVVFDEFNVRQHLEMPDLSYDAYISSGGPGSPIESINSSWENAYFNWLKEVENFNADEENLYKKKVFFICHSFQLACRYYNIGNVCKRKSTSFGIFPVHVVGFPTDELIFEGLANPFYAVDSRDYQVIEPNYDIIQQMGASILAIEKDRPHIPLERAIMAIRFNEHFIGTQFHPEADAIGMSMYLQRDDKKDTIIKNHGEEKWESMVEQLQDPDKIIYTYNHVIPNFLNSLIGDLVY